MLLLEGVGHVESGDVVSRRAAGYPDGRVLVGLVSEDVELWQLSAFLVLVQNLANEVQVSIFNFQSRFNIFLLFFLRRNQFCPSIFQCFSGFPSFFEVA